MKRKFIYCLLLVLPLCWQPAFAGIIVNAKELVLENTVMRQVLLYGDGSIKPSSIYDKKAGRELLANAPSPWFEFVANHQLLTANDRMWQYQSHQLRQLNTGGEDVDLVF